ncbi:VWA domain-containing protein [Shewanella schlegeliana]|uniref:VWA domain-containing protein n=1 Tax=Shewanella schlegeliana TaxID=190308 RepID=A0ABS1T304_9GAMM|nr:VWA domain-containing protein [Shewanella schlegeliana]MBL4915178.1 VWA domain-containing protein [Shewanella schlegeliana]MCL1110954.1 VWA domain-containing protein [Shewanella schlegeliana]GIU29457.1 transporter [Shewanella schlegeliana]
MSEFHFIRPWALFALIPYLYWLWVNYRRQQTLDAKFPLAKHLAAHLRTDITSSLWLSPKTMLPLLIGLLIIIVSGPTWQPQEGSLSKNRSPLILVIDLSSSMAESDIAPSRIESAKYKLATLLEEKRDGLLGAWVYAGSGHQLLPPTEDREVLTLYLSSLHTQLVPRQGKNLASVLEQLRALEQQRALEQSRLQQSEPPLPASIVVIGDAIDNQAREALIAHQDNSQDQLLFWKFGFASSMSAPSGVSQLQMSSDDSDISAIINWSNSVNFFDPTDKDIVWQEVGYWLVFPTLLLSLLWFRRGWSIRWLASLLFVPWLTLSPVTEVYASELTTNSVNSEQCDNLVMRLFLTPDQQGQWFYKQQNYRCAANSFVDPRWKVEALMRSQQWEWALTMLNTQPDSIERSFNIALSYLHLARFRSSQRWFMQVLALEPDNQQAKDNLALLEEIFELMALRAQGQGTAGEDMTADVIDSLQEDMQIDEPADKIDEINSADLMAEEHLTKIWLEQVKHNPAVFLRNKFTIQLQQFEQATEGTDKSKLVPESADGVGITERGEH